MMDIRFIIYSPLYYSCRCNSFYTTLFCTSKRVFGLVATRDKCVMCHVLTVDLFVRDCESVNGARSFCSFLPRMNMKRVNYRGATASGESHLFIYHRSQLD